MAEPPSPSSPPPQPPQQKWTTLEELLLACAVNRYGTSDWDSIAKQLQKRVVSSSSSSLSPFTPHLCQQKYLDLKRRFVSNGNHVNGNSNGHDTGFWLDELRKLRVAELRNELERYDLSIVSLQMKVKRLKEEREKMKDGRDNPDLERESENEKPSVKPETEPVGPDLATKPEMVVVEDSYDGSSNSKKGEGGEAVKERVDSVELSESVAESKGGEGDVNSTTRRESGKKEKMVEVVLVSGSSSGDDNQSAATKVVENSKNLRLVEFLELVRVQKLGSVLSNRFGGQESPRYRNLIRQHIDLGMIQRRLDEGQYSDCYTKFYRDLMLLVSNAIVFFNKKSLEYKAALELRQLVSDHSRSNLNPNKSPPPKTNPSTPTPPKPPKSEPSSATYIANLKPKLAITGPVIACRKRSSIAGKPAQSGEKKELVGEIPASVEKTASSFNAVTRKRTRDHSIGSRSSSGKESSGNTLRPNMSPSPSLAQQPSPNTTPVSAKGDKRKLRPGGSSSKVNQSPESGDGLLLDLLKNATVQKNANKGNKRKDTTPRNGSGGKSGGSGGKSGKEKAKAEEGKETPLSKSSSRQPKRAATVAAMGKRGRDGGKEAESLPKKRQRK